MEDDLPPPSIPSIDSGGVLPPPPLIPAPNLTTVPLPAPMVQPTVVTPPTPMQPIVPELAPVSPPNPFVALQPVVEPTPVEIAPVENVEEDWATPEPEVEPEPEPQMQPDDEWGDMAGDWDDAGDTLTTAAATFAQTQHENRRGEGPRDAAEQTLRSLPGTVAGEDGWYFDREGRPSQWNHTDENGWSQE